MPKKKNQGKKPWAGRFTEGTAREVEAFTESISFDARLWKYDIQGSIAHATMLAKQGIISRLDADLIIKGLNGIARDIADGRFKFRQGLEDVHMNIEHALTERTGQAGAKLHTARSRNDQIALDLRLYLRDEIQAIQGLVRGLEKEFLAQAQRHAGAIMPGYTHLQRAQPVLLSHYLLAYIAMFERDRDRLEDCLKRLDVLPLGACALAGTGLPTDRRITARLLGFKEVSENSMDSVSDRDFVMEFLSNAAILMSHISRFSEELVLWASTEFSFIELPDSFTTGSSIMPQKKNPDVAELARGKTGRVYGNLMGMLTIMKGLPLSYNRDMQEDKPLLFDTVDTLKSVLGVLAPMVRGIAFKTGRLRETAAEGYSTATDMAEYLVKKGVPFRQAHGITGKAVLLALQSGKELEELPLADLKALSPAFEKDVFAVLGPEASVRAKKSLGGTAPELVRKSLGATEKRLAKGAQQARKGPARKKG
ncbi:MAG: argininosuccinate lyase [Actinomycetota bacterium]|nr:argininosuccinate lyase [Actinomycetota bacterium]